MMYKQLLVSAVGVLFAMSGRSEFMPFTVHVEPLYGQFRISWAPSNAPSYNIYSYTWTAMDSEDWGGTTGWIPTSPIPAQWCGNTTRNYFIVQPGAYNKFGRSYSAFEFSVIAADLNGVSSVQPNARIAPPSLQCFSAYYPEGTTPTISYWLKSDKGQTLEAGDTCDVVMKYEYSKHRGTEMEVWDRAIVWKITSGGEYASFVDDEYLDFDYWDGERVAYSRRYGVRVLANENLESEQTITVKGSLLSSDPFDTSTIVRSINIELKPMVKVNFVVNSVVELSEQERRYSAGKPYGSFPTATRIGYDFEGWHTADGVRVDETTVVSKDITELYAKWKLKAPWADGEYSDVVDVEGKFADAADDVLFRFTITDGLAILTDVGSDALPSNLVIPETQGGCPVVAIGDYAFNDRDELETVTIPAGVKQIGVGAFSYCSNLMDVIFKGVKDFIVFGPEKYLTGVFEGTPYENEFFALEVVDGIVIDFVGNLPERLAVPEGVTGIAEGFGSWYGDYEMWGALKEVVVPASMKEIGANTFNLCQNLEDVTFVGNPLAVEIGSYAFSETPARSKLSKITWGTSSATGVRGVMGFSGPVLEHVVLPEGTEAIFSWSFYGMSGMKSVTIPASVNWLDERSFAYCNDLDVVRFLGQPPAFFHYDSGLFDHATKIYYPQKYADLWSEIVPQEIFAGYVEPEGEYCFVTFDLGYDSGAQRVGGGALVQSVGMGKAANEPEVQAYAGWKLAGWDADFSSVTSNMVVHAQYQRNGVDDPYEDGEYTATIDGCAWKFRVKNGVAEIIVNYSALWPSHVQIPGTLGNCPVVAIGSQAFAWKGTITRVTIPKSVSAIDMSAFQGCSALVSFDVDAENQNYCSIDGILYDKPKTTLVCAPAGLSDVVVPNGVTTIGANSFSYCSNVKSVILPQGVVTIGDSAFAYCRSLTDVTFKGDVPISVGYDAFVSEPSGGTPSLSIHYPEGNETWNPLPSSDYWYGAENVTFVPWSNSTIHVPASQTGGVELNVEDEWFEQYPTFETKFGSDKGVAMLSKTGKKDGAGNDMFVWQDYVAGTDPTDETDVFTASITIVDGKVKVSYTPELDDARKALRKYTTWGKVKLTDKDWSVVGEGEAGNFNFFKVTVEMR